MKKIYLLIFILILSKGYAETLNTAEHWFQKGYNSNKNGKYHIAVLQYQKALRFSPEDAVINLNMGLAYVNDGKNMEALECFKKVIEIDSCNAAAYYNMGLIHYYEGNTEKEMECYQKAIYFDSNYALAYYNMGIIYYNNDDTEKATEYHQIAIEIGTDDAFEFYKFGIFYAEKGWKNIALRNFYEAGLIYIKQNDSIEALYIIEIMDTLKQDSELINKLKSKLEQDLPIKFK